MHNDLLQQFLMSRSRADLEALVRSEHAWLLGVARKITRDSDLAEDAVQEVFVKLIESAPAANDVRTSRGLLAAYVIGAARTLVRGKLRREHRERVASRAETLAHDERDAEFDSELDEVRAAVFALPDAHRACVELRYFGGLSADEIGRTLGCARRTVDERLASARESLRRRLQPHAFAMFAAEMQNVTVAPPIEPSREFAERLEQLLRDPSLVARTSAAGAGVTLLWISVVLVVAVGAVAVWTAERSSTPVAGIAAQSPARPDHAAATANTDEPANAPTPERVATPSRADLVIARAQVRSTADLRVHVLDESGAYVRAGELRFEPDSFASSAALLSLMQREDLAQFAELLAPIQLAGRNPFEVRGLPNELVRNSFRAYAVVPRFGTPVPATFVLDDNKLCEVTLIVRAPRSVTISVQDAATHRPLDRATVLSNTELDRRDLGAAAALRERAPGAGKSDALGLCVLDGLGAGEHEIEVHAAGHVSARGKLAADANHLVLALAAQFAAPSVIVDVTDPGNMPIVDVLVICHQPGSKLDHRANTDAWGRCRFADLEPGSWTVTLDALPYAELRAKHKWSGENECFGTSIELEDGETKRVQLGFLAGTAAWAIEAVDARGQPCGDVQVLVSGPTQRAATTRKDGRVLFEHLPAGSWGFEVNGWSSRPRDIAEDSMRTDRVELGHARIRGRVMLADTGAPAAGATVIASGDVYAMYACDEDGQFHLVNVPNGTFVVGVGALGYANAEATVQVKDGDPPPLELTLKR